jgi:carboxylesterase type B
MGESAGGTSICAHLLLDYYKPPTPPRPYYGVIISSAACERRILFSEAYGYSLGSLFSQRLGCDPKKFQGNGTQLLECIRRRSAGQILECDHNITYLDDPTLSDWYPILHSSVWPLDVWDRFDAGNFSSVRTMIGSNLEESGFFFYWNFGKDLNYSDANVVSDSNITDALQHFPGWNASRASSAVSMYPSTLGLTPFGRYRAITTDNWLTCAVRSNVDILIKAGKITSKPVYWYRFDVPLP